MTSKEIRERLLAQPVPEDVAAATAENGGLPPAPLCWVCRKQVEDVSYGVRELWIHGMIGEPNLPIVTADLGHARHPKGAVLHTKCKPGTARWARHQDRSDQGARLWLTRFGYDPDDVGDTEEGEDMAATKKSRSAKRAKADAKPKAERPRDKRIPPPGTVLRKEYGGKEHEVRITTTGFNYNGETYKSLSAVAHIITKKKYAHGMSGFVFFKKEMEEKTGAAA